MPQRRPTITRLPLKMPKLRGGDDDDGDRSWLLRLDCFKQVGDGGGEILGPSAGTNCDEMIISNFPSHTKYSPVFSTSMHNIQ